MPPELETLKDDLVNDLRDNLAEMGAKSQEDAEELAKYAAERAKHLAKAYGEPGFSRAVRAERDNVMLKTAITAVERADEADQRIRGLIHGFLTSAARVAATLSL